jgi:signal transduction histidine kinase
VDPDALRQILLNLLDNAAKYGPDGQTVVVGTSRDGAHVRIWVEDEGPGIPEAERARVWEPYIRLERGEEHATGGSGIGLAVVKELVELHGGRAWAEDASHGGARLVVELPAGDAAGTTSEPLAELTNASGK